MSQWISAAVDRRKPDELVFFQFPDFVEIYNYNQYFEETWFTYRILFRFYFSFSTLQIPKRTISFEIRMRKKSTVRFRVTFNTMQRKEKLHFNHFRMLMACVWCVYLIALSELRLPGRKMNRNKIESEGEKNCKECVTALDVWKQPHFWDRITEMI